MEFNEKLQQLRKLHSLTQDELAQKLYVSRTAISKWELGRGYPNIESLKMISQYFSVSIDDLLSGEELISLAQNEKLESTRNLCGLAFGILDCMIAVLFFLPFFGLPENDMIASVSLLSLNNANDMIRIIFIIIVSITVLYGIGELAFQNVSHTAWLKHKYTVSLSLSILGTMIFIISPQPYAASFILCILVLKGTLFLKSR